MNDPVFERGLRDFLAVCNVVKTFRNIRILQISTRPFDFWTTMCNEGELLEKFNIQLSPIPIDVYKRQGYETVFCHVDINDAQYQMQINEILSDTESAVVLLGTEMLEEDFEPFTHAKNKIILLDGWLSLIHI